MLDNVGLKVRKHQSLCKLRLPLKDACESTLCLVVDRWRRNDTSDNVIVLIVVVISLIDDRSCRAR
jgi:hypothetical protein